MKKFCFLLLVLQSTFVFSNDLRFNKFSTIDGLSNESSYVLAQDNDGYLWIGTYDGLDRFDGKNFKVYKNDRNDSTSLCGNVIMDLFLDTDGVLWIATNKGVCMYNKYTDSFEQPFIELKASYCKTGVQDISGNYWFGSGSFIYEYSQDKKLKKVLNQNLETVFGDASIYSLGTNSKGLLWIGTQEKGIYSYDPVKNQMRSFTEVNTQQIFSIFIDSHDNVWLGSQNEASYVYLANDDQFYNLREADCPIHLPLYDISCAAEDKDGNFWFGNWGSGLTYYNYKTNSYTHYLHNPSDNTSISTGAIEYIIQDNEGNLWAVGNTFGINVIYKNNKAFNSVKDIYSSQAAIHSSPTTGITEDIQGNLWFGTDGKGIAVWNPITQQFKSYQYNPNNPKSYGGTSVLNLFADSRGRVWAGGYNSGFNLFNTTTEDFIVFRADKEPPYYLSGRDVRYITEDENGKIWVVTNGGGINIFDPQTLERDEINVNNGGLISDDCLMVLLDNKNRAWIATYNGLTIYDRTNKTIKNYLEDKKIEGSIPASWVYTVYQDTKDRFWIGTQSGLALFKEETNNFKVYLEEDGLPNNTIMSIIEDDNSKLWIATNKGISKFDPEIETFMNFSVEDGLPDNQFRMNSVHKTADGQLFFGANNGVLNFYPSQIKQNPTKPILLFTELYINNSQIKPASSAILKQHINYAQRIKLKHKQNFLRIDFIALSYFHAEKNRYEFKLEGVNDDWVENGNGTSASFTNLRHGHYTFYVRAYNNDGVPSEVRSIKIRIRPAWYNTLLFYFLLIGIVIYSIYKFIRLRETETKRDREILESKISEGEKAIEEKVQLLETQQKELLERDSKEKEIRFHYEGIAKFSDIISQNRKDVEELSTSLISELVHYVGANAGVVYVTDDSESQQIILRASGEFCFDSDQDKKYEFEAGEGYVGTCYKEKKSIEICDLPSGYIVLRSGLGHTSLNYSILVPVIHENNCLAVIEIAALAVLPKYKIAFVEKIAENFSSVLAISKANEKTKEMLEQNKIQSEELMAQEEEMRQNLEEMQATQEDLKRQMEANNIAQAELTKEKILVDTLLKTAREKIYFKDLESRFIKVSQSMAADFKLSNTDELLGKNDFDFFTEEHARPAFEDEMKIIETGKPIIDKIEKETHADGRITYVSTSKMPLYDENSKIIGTFGISKDVTAAIEMEHEIKHRNEELQAQEEELRQNLEEMQTVQENLESQMIENKKMHEVLAKEKALLDAIMNNLPDYIYFKDKDSRFIRISKSMLPLFPVDKLDDMIGKSDFDFHTQENAMKYYNDEMQIIKSGNGLVDLIGHEVLDNGLDQWVSSTKLPLYDEAGNCIGTFGISKNITELKEHEIASTKLAEELKQQKTELDKKLAKIISEIDAKNAVIKTLEQKLKTTQK